MGNTTSLQLYDFEKTAEFLSNKVYEDPLAKLSYHFNEYYRCIIEGSVKSTKQAKTKDIQDFLTFFLDNLRADVKDLWTPSITKSFVKHLYMDNKLKGTTVNRKIATLKHAASWIHRQYPFKTGHPCEGVRDVQIGVVGWNGLTDKDIRRINAAIDIRMATCKRKNQNPLIEAVVINILLNTGLRESELCNLNYSQYNSRALVYIKRKGNKITDRLPLPTDTRTLLNQYLETRGELMPDDPLILNKRHKRIRPNDIAYICEQVRNVANCHLSKPEHLQFTPHSLRHAFLKRVADKLGVHTAQELSGNVSMKEIWRYTRPSYEEAEQGVENLYK